jgi:hypothetical protein
MGRHYVPKDPTRHAAWLRSNVQAQLEKGIARAGGEDILSPLQASMAEWYGERSPDEKLLIVELIMRLIDVQDERALERGISNANFGPIAALQVLGAALAYSNRWRSCK